MPEITAPGHNPLQKYFRQPKLYITLPSGGRFYSSNAIEMTETGELPVFSMTAKDELIMKTPDALLNGQATVDVIQSCIPSIKNAWAMPSIDLDAALIAIRLATYGEMMTLKIKTPVTGEEKEMQVDLRVLLDQFANLEFNSVVPVNEDLKINLRPLSYKEFTRRAIKTFEEQRIFNIVNDQTISDEDKLQAFTNSFAKLTELTVDMIALSIENIQLGDEVITNRKHIDEFIKNTDKSFFNVVTNHLDNERKKFTLKPMIAEATAEEIEKGVPKTYEVPITFDQSNFFG
jgi:hypothetical protein